MSEAAKSPKDTAYVQDFRQRRRKDGDKRVEFYAERALQEAAGLAANSAMGLNRNTRTGKPLMGVGMKCLAELGADLWPVIASDIERRGDWDVSLLEPLETLLTLKRDVMQRTGMTSDQAGEWIALTIRRDLLTVPARAGLSPSEGATLGTPGAPSHSHSPTTDDQQEN